MSQLTAYKCNVCNFTTHSQTSLDITGWATVSFAVRIRGSRAYEESKKEVRKKILHSLGDRLHVCPGCVAKFANSEINLKLLSDKSA